MRVMIDGHPFDTHHWSLRAKNWINHDYLQQHVVSVATKPMTSVPANAKTQISILFMTW